MAIIGCIYKFLLKVKQDEKKRQEQSILTDRLNELQTEYDDRLEREVEQAELKFHKKGQAEL